MADVPLLRAVSHSHHSKDGEFLDFTLEFADGSATRFEALTSDFTSAMSIFAQCQISARKARGAKGKFDAGGAPPSDVVVIDPKRLGLIVGPERLPYLVVYRSNGPPLGIRLTVEDAQRLAGAFQRLLQKVVLTPEPKYACPVPQRLFPKSAQVMSALDQKPTSAPSSPMSAKCHKPTFCRAQAGS